MISSVIRLCVLRVLCGEEYVSMDALSVLLIGHVARDEFRDVQAFLAAHTQLTVAPGTAEGLADLEEAEIAPELIVVAAAWPGEFTAAEIERLRQAAPLARLLALVGSWSEGETRSGQPWSGVPRIYAHQFVARFGVELERLARGAAPTWSLPVTATEDERLLEGIRHSTEKCLTPLQQKIAVVAHDFQTAESLADALRSRGRQAFRWRQAIEDAALTDEPPDVILCDAPTEADTFRALGQITAHAPGVPIVALMDFPRAEDRAAALKAGASAVISKPFLLEDLFWQIERLRVAQALGA